MDSTKNTDGKRTRFQGPKRQLMIINSCRDLIIEYGFSELSLRKVAKKAGIGLSSLQYHFKTKEDLIQAVILNTRDMFKQQSVEIKSHTEQDPQLQFKIIALWLINDLKQKETAHLFTQLWAQSLIDDFTGRVVDQIYQEYCEFFADLIMKLRPELTINLAIERSVKIVSLIEGLTLFIGSKKRSFLNNIHDLENSTVETALKIAMG